MYVCVCDFILFSFEVNDRRDFGGQDQQKHSLSFGSDDQSSKSFDSGTQTPRPSTRDQSSQVDGIVSINGKF